MTEVTQSPFLQALGFAIINSLWQYALLWLLYLLVNTIFKFNCHQKYVSGVALQFTGFFWFAGTLSFYYYECLSGAPMSPLSTQLTLKSSLPTTFSLNSLIFYVALKIELILPYLSLSYILLLVGFLIKTVKSYNEIEKIKSTGLEKISFECRLFVQKLSLQLGIKNQVEIYLSNIVKSPVTVGFLKPVILIPVATINNLTTEQLEAVLLHELAHISRHDYLMNLILVVTESALFFNPFMQLISRQIKEERENCCDDLVLQYEYNSTQYAKALLTIAKNRVESHFFAMSATDNNKVLLQRVKRMIDKKDTTADYRQQLLALLLTTSLIAFIAIITPDLGSSRYSDGKKNLPLTPFAAKVDNPLFNPVFFLVKNENLIARTRAEKTSSAVKIVDNKQITHSNHKVVNPSKSFNIQQQLELELQEINEAEHHHLQEIVTNAVADVEAGEEIERKIRSSNWERIQKQLEVAARHAEAEMNLFWTTNNVRVDVDKTLREVQKLKAKIEKNSKLLKCFDGTKQAAEQQEKEAQMLQQHQLEKLAEVLKQQVLELENHKVYLKKLNHLPAVPEEVAAPPAPTSFELENFSYTFAPRVRRVVVQPAPVKSPSNEKVRVRPSREQRVQLPVAAPDETAPERVEVVSRRIIVRI